MVRVSKLADYGFVLLCHMALGGTMGTEQGFSWFSAATLAKEAGLPLPTVRKLLKLLGAAGLVAASRGAAGGYRLVRSVEAISVLDVLRAVEGPVHLTACSGESGSRCHLEHTCPARAGWRRISATINGLLSGLTLKDMLATPSNCAPKGPLRARKEV